MKLFFLYFFPPYFHSCKTIKDLQIRDFLQVFYSLLSYLTNYTLYLVTMIWWRQGSLNYWSIPYHHLVCSRCIWILVDFWDLGKIYITKRRRKWLLVSSSSFFRRQPFVCVCWQLKVIIEWDVMEIRFERGFFWRRRIFFCGDFYVDIILLLCGFSAYFFLYIWWSRTFELHDTWGT